ncbi:MAG: hypothetical protein JST92_26925 [Deltaproteobacteria bacterium]|nr:hypothetical protein [Deltaproteobacteria bacterium]
MSRQNTKRSGHKHETRITLVARAQVAYEVLCDLMARPHKSARAQAAIAEAKARLSSLNRALALVALQSVAAA